MWKWNEKVRDTKETLGKNDELYVTSSTFLNYMKRKCAMEMKKHVKFKKKTLQDINEKFW